MAADDQSITPKLRHRLTTLDSSFLYAETASNPLHIGSLAIFEGHIPFEEIVRSVRQRLHLLPRYQQRLATVPLNLAHPTVEDDPDFNLENHVRLYQMCPDLSEPEMVDVVMRQYQSVLHRNHPLWAFVSFENWNGNTCILSKTHHALVDGVSGIELIKHLYDFRPDAPLPEPPAVAAPAPVPGRVESFLSATQDILTARIDAVFGLARGLVREPGAIAQRAGQMIAGLSQIASLAARPIAATPWNSMPATSQRSLAWLRNSFGEYRAIRTAFGGTVNDVVLAVLTEGAARYLKHHGYPTDRPLRLGCPVNVRRPEEISDLGNRVSMMFPELPSEPMDIVERLKLASQETERIKTAGAAQALERLTTLGELAPASLLAALTRAGTLGLEAGAALAKIANWKPSPRGLMMPPLGINFVATNVPGVQVPQYFCGHRCLDQIGLVPLGGNLGYGVAILSYNGNLYLGMMAETRMMPDVALMKSYVSEAFEDLKRAVQAETMKALPSAHIEIPAPKARTAARMTAPPPTAAEPVQAVRSSLSAENGQITPNGENLQYQGDSAPKPQLEQHQDIPNAA